ncbi:MAG TPA: TspO/MBR family protein [Gemmatimonadaceae bacterium]|nr:TspO/MBR family protein [Gemmatimonadaceae bacterium]
MTAPGTEYPSGTIAHAFTPFQMNRPTKSRQALGLVAFLAVTFAAGIVGAIASISAVKFYAELSKPSWAPPAWLFGPVWSVLYVMIAVSAWLVWRDHGLRGARTPLIVWVLQLVANALWTWLFFTLRSGALSMAEIVVLWLLIATTIRMFWPLDRIAALLLVPYLVWVSFASALTYACWTRNPMLLG